MVDPGWYVDPWDGRRGRWWDGGRWTEHVTGRGRPPRWNPPVAARPAQQVPPAAAPEPVPEEPAAEVVRGRPRTGPPPRREVRAWWLDAEAAGATEPPIELREPLPRGMAASGVAALVAGAGVLGFWAALGPAGALAAAGTALLFTGGAAAITGSPSWLRLTTRPAALAALVVGVALVVTGVVLLAGPAAPPGG